MFSAAFPILRSPDLTRAVDFYRVTFLRRRAAASFAA